MKDSSRPTVGRVAFFTTDPREGCTGGFLLGAALYIASEIYSGGSNTTVTAGPFILTLLAFAAGGAALARMNNTSRDLPEPPRSHSKAWR